MARTDPPTVVTLQELDGRFYINAVRGQPARYYLGTTRDTKVSCVLGLVPVAPARPPRLERLWVWLVGCVGCGGGGYCAGTGGCGGGGYCAGTGMVLVACCLMWLWSGCLARVFVCALVWLSRSFVRCVLCTVGSTSAVVGPPTPSPAWRDDGGEASAVFTSV